MENFLVEVVNLLKTAKVGRTRALCATPSLRRFCTRILILSLTEFYNRLCTVANLLFDGQFFCSQRLELLIRHLGNFLSLLRLSNNLCLKVSNRQFETLHGWLLFHSRKVLLKATVAVAVQLVPSTVGDAQVRLLHLHLPHNLRNTSVELEARERNALILAIRQRHNHIHRLLLLVAEAAVRGKLFLYANVIGWQTLFQSRRYLLILVHMFQ